MIIKLKGADFSTNNINTLLNNWFISLSLGSGATSSNTATSVAKGAAYSNIITIAEGYELGSAGVTVTMGGTAITPTISGNTITISIASVTGNVIIKVPTVNTSTGEESGGSSEGVLPTGYTALANITTNGSQYIDTGFTPNVNTKIETAFSVTELATQAIFGAQNSNNNPAFKSYILAETNSKFGDKAASNELTANATYTLNMSKDGVTVNGSNVPFTGYTYSGDTGCPIYLLCNNNAGEATQFATNVTMSSFKIWDNGTLVRNFVPCSNSSGTKGMYDLVNSLFYELSDGSGDSGSGDSGSSGLEAYSNTVSGDTTTVDELCSRDVWHDTKAINISEKAWYVGGNNRSTAYYLKLPVGTVITSNSDYKMYVTHSTAADVGTYDGTGSGGWTSSYTVDKDCWTHICISMASDSSTSGTPGVVGVEEAYQSVSINIPNASAISVSRTADTENYIISKG